MTLLAAEVMLKISASNRLSPSLLYYKTAFLLDCAVDFLPLLAFYRFFQFAILSPDKATLGFSFRQRRFAGPIPLTPPAKVISLFLKLSRYLNGAKPFFL